ncbi:indole-3-acetic acid-amido synthetase GH3.10 [Elaeis guineensis]|uniref:Indole-3-acetic acid-amido synthetase GH3.10 n=1 Tax=Elaeis guineensis var. tenera TaxID=51953 RepID=A0A6I9Q8Z9_ELAGV|nr:indole-3-acetic acid-amido synthetase GH3.10 [Elaeis guineensis]
MVLGKGRERNSEHQAPKPIFGDSGGAVIAAIIPIPDRQPTMTVEGAAAASGDQEIIAWFEGVAENAGLVQTQTLRRIIELNHSTEYLQKWLGRDLRVQDLDPVALESLFTSSVPLASHADHEPYIQRIADGDTSPLLTQEPITMLSLSSGTTDGRPKQVPFTRFSCQSSLQIFRLGAAYRSRLFPVRAGGRILEFIYGSKQFQSKGGLTVGTATTHYFASEEFKTRQKSTDSFVCSPYEVISEGDYNQSTYCHLLLGLAFCDQVEVIASTFAYSIVQAFTSFEELWEELCEDLREGTLSTKITSPEMRRAVMGCLTPSASLASKIEKKCRELEESNWSSLIPKLWPNAKYIYSIMTGSMQPYLKKLRHHAGDLALICADYGSTESWIGVNLEPSDPPERATFTVIPTFSYFEFIPLYRRKEQDHSSSVITDDFVEGEPLPLSEVKVGQQYEVVLTTFTGLYRYRLGDVVEVAGFYKGAPKLTFICRRKLILTVNIDKNTERDLQLVVEEGSRLLSQTRAELVDFTSHADLAVHPGHYVIYWEIKGEAEDRILNACSREMDAAFADHGYVVSRKTGSIGPLELRIVESGTFRRILDYCIGNGAAMSQFKTPRCTTNQVLLRILDRCTVKSFWSTAYG